MHRSQGSANCVALATGAESFKHLHRWHSIIGERLVRGGAQMYGGAPGQALITADEKKSSLEVVGKRSSRIVFFWRGDERALLSSVMFFSNHCAVGIAKN
ncbi:hypothetical protein CEXT_462121 [Caerostris extrusa]|uniref:Uncharacterized protein n=1 Tax=Caerostris extrusa TaxID=172846 RepID=A0AAV4P6Z9_CAEEX|nr:hypothetical protein CEXT_462121 [Caerostris extrusa]